MRRATHSHCSLLRFSLWFVVVGAGAMAEEPKRREAKIRVHDGVEIAVALYMPEGEGPFPVVLGAAPYRYDNNTLPASSIRSMAS